MHRVIEVGRLRCTGTRLLRGMAIYVFGREGRGKQPDSQDSRRARAVSSSFSMEVSRSSSPDESPQDLWSSILDSVSSSRSTPAKQVILLGEPSSGKSAIAAALLKETKDEKETSLDFAMGYDWADVKDDAEEGEAPACLRLFSLTLLQTLLPVSLCTLSPPLPNHIFLYYPTLYPREALFLIRLSLSPSTGRNLGPLSSN